MPVKDARDLKGKSGLTRLINATKYSADGIRTAFKNEEAFRQESLGAVVLVPVAVFDAVSQPLSLRCVVSRDFVLVTELLNSGIEAAIDRIGPEIHPLSKYAKDAGSAAVLFALTFTVITWVSVILSIFFA